MINPGLKTPAGAGVVALALLGSGGSLHADTIWVPDDYPTIQQAVDASAHDDTVIVADGIWTGAGNTEIHMYGKGIKLRSENGPDYCIIDCQNNNRAFELYEGETSATRINGFTMRNGRGLYGGAMHLNGVSPKINECIFEDNHATERAGALYCKNASPIIRDCVFQNNHSDSYGGGLMTWENSFPDLKRCAFKGNTAVDGGGGFKDAEYAEATLVDCLFEDNSARRGGGISIYDDHFYLTGCRFIGNSAEVTSGGGIDATSICRVYATNCLFVDNSAAASGGAARIVDGYLYLDSCTIAGNSADEGGGIACEDGSAYVSNSVLWGDTPEEIGGYGVVVLYSLVEGGWEGDGNLDADPQFAGPDIDDYRLGGASPCIDAGDNTAVPDDVITDLNGNPRFVDDPCISDTGVGDPPLVDMGAYELQPEEMCPADVNCDETVDIDDLFAVLGHWGPCDDCLEDVNEDGIVDIDDVFDILALWGPCP